jgi:hypothetical protein
MDRGEYRQGMAESLPIACSLGASDLQRRLAEIAAVGADGLLGRALEDGRQVLRFRANAEVQERLQAIVAAEAECCSFLGLSLSEASGELVLVIEAADEAQPVADELARAFAATSG